MPKRVVDGEGLWRSDKLARVQPAPWRAEYPPGGTLDCGRASGLGQECVCLATRGRKRAGCFRSYR